MGALLSEARVSDDGRTLHLFFWHGTFDEVPNDAPFPWIDCTFNLTDQEAQRALDSLEIGK